METNQGRQKETDFFFDNGNMGTDFFLGNRNMG